MKYLLPFLEGLPDGPNLSDPEFQRLLLEVQAGKNNKSNEAFYESLEGIVQELKSSPESQHFQRPVSKRDAPDYYDIIKKPMDLYTISKQIKAHKYKNKAEFQADLDQIWENSFIYNPEGHALRACARFLKQKADHHLEFLADKNERGSAALLPIPAVDSSSRQLSVQPSGHAPLQPSPLRASSQLPGAEEDAAGESDDGGMDVDGSFRNEAGAGPQSQTAANETQTTRQGTPAGRARSGSRGGREGSIISVNGDRRGSISKLNGADSSSIAPYRPKLQTTLENSPAYIRTPYSMTQHLALSLTHAGPSTLSHSRYKELIQAAAPPAWYSAAVDDEATEVDGGWWGAVAKDEAYTTGLPAVPSMLDSDLDLPRRARISAKHPASPKANGHQLDGTKEETPALDPPGPVKLETLVHRNVDKLHQARRVMHQIQDFQRMEAEDAVLPDFAAIEVREKAREKEERIERKRRRAEEAIEAKKRRKLGGDVGAKEATLTLKRATAGMLAHAGFEGANEVSLDMLTRVLEDHLTNIGRTFRLFIDGYADKMSSEEIVLHTLHENGQVETQDLEAHIKDDIEREGAKIAEMARKVKQAFKEVISPVVEDDMLFDESRGMLADGNFAEELGEDFLGLRELGIDKEFGLSSLSVPSALFHGRRRRLANADQSAKQNLPDYPPPPPFVPLNQNTLSNHLPALLHAFFATRMEAGKGLADDEAFDPAHAQISSMGQINIKGGSSGGAMVKKKKDGDGDKSIAKPIKPKKAVQPGVGKGNWVRPSKEEKEKRAAEKKSQMENAVNEASTNGVPNPPVISSAA